MNYHVIAVTREIVKTTAAADGVNIFGTLALAKQDAINRYMMDIAAAREEIKIVKSLRDRDLADDMAESLADLPDLDAEDDLELVEEIVSGEVPGDEYAEAMEEELRDGNL